MLEQESDLSVLTSVDRDSLANLIKKEASRRVKNTESLHSNRFIIIDTRSMYKKFYFDAN